MKGEHAQKNRIVKEEKVISDLKDALNKATGKERAIIFEKMGDAYHNMDKGPKAMICYEEAIRAGGDSIDLIEKYSELLGMAGGQQKAVELLDSAAARAKTQKEKGRLLAKKAMFIRYIGKFEEAMKESEKALSLLNGQDEGDPQVRLALAEANSSIGICHWEMGELKEAMQSFEKALAYYEANKDHRGIARIKNNIGLINLYLGDSDKALDYLNKALQSFEEVDIGGDNGMILTNIALAYQIKGDYEKAEQFYKKSIKIHMGVNKHYGAHLCHINLADMFVDKGDYVKAKGWAERALKGFQEVKDEARMAMVFATMSRIELMEGNPEKAHRTIEKALTMALNQKANETVGVALRVKGTIAAARKDFKTAEASVKESLDVFRKSQYKFGIGRSLMELALVFLAKGDRVQAKAAAVSARDALTPLGAKHELAILDGLGL